MSFGEGRTVLQGGDHGHESGIKGITVVIYARRVNVEYPNCLSRVYAERR
jgi:hypothetical protein